jgi:hypothetical protein
MTSRQQRQLRHALHKLEIAERMVSEARETIAAIQTPRRKGPQAESLGKMGTVHRVEPSL